MVLHGAGAASDTLGAMSRATPMEPGRTRGTPWPGVRPWLLMFAAAAGLRVAGAWLANGPGAHALPDPAAWDAVAWNLARGAGFSLEGAGGLQPTAVVPPLGPWITSLLYRAVGHQAVAAVLLGCAVGGLVPLMLAAFATRMFGSVVGRTAGWLAVVHPLLVTSCGRSLPETAFAVVLLLALLLSAEWLKTPSAGRAFGTGVAWGLAALANPVAFALPLVVAAWAWLPLGFAMSAGGRLRQVGWLLLGVALAVGPWTLRNALVLHAFVPVSAGAAGALPASDASRAWTSPTGPGGPGVALRLQELARAPGAASAWTAAALPLALWGLWRSLRGARRWFQSLGLWVLLGLAWPGGAFSGPPRMRVPAEPLVMLFAAAGIDDLVRRLRARSRGLRLVERGEV